MREVSYFLGANFRKKVVRRFVGFPEIGKFFKIFLAFQRK